MHEVEFVKSDVDLVPSDDKVEYEIVGPSGAVGRADSIRGGMVMPSTSDTTTGKALDLNAALDLGNLKLKQLKRVRRFLSQKKADIINATELKLRTKKNRKKAKTAKASRKRNR